MKIGILFVLLALTFTTALGHANPSRINKRYQQQNWTNSNETSSNDTTSQQYCSSIQDIDVQAPYPNVWAELSHSVVVDIYNWLIQPSLNLNLTDPSIATVTDNYVWLIEKLHTNKSSVLDFIDNNGTMPVTYARVVIVENGRADPVVQEYMVGPIPISNSTTIQKLDYIYQRPGTVPFNAGLLDKQREDLYDIKISEVMCSIKNITLDLFGYFYCGKNSSTLTYEFATPFSKNGSSTILWVWFEQSDNSKQPYGGATIMPVGFQIGLDVSGTDPSLHKLLLVSYNDQFYFSLDDFIAAYTNGSLQRAPKPNRDQTWTSPERKQTRVRPLDDKSSPISAEPEGKRYKVNATEKYAEWMDWSFYIVHTRDLGITLYDIKFKGQRIVYEIGLQEATAQYAGSNPATASTAYLDRWYGFGEWQYELLEGFDVPLGSTLLDTFYHKSGQTITNRNSIAIFEIDPGMPIQRHTSAELGGQWYWIESLKDPVLVVRCIDTVGNYDYLFDYIFHLDGTMEVKSGATGYIQAMFDTALERQYGWRVHDVLNSGIHTHNLNFKVDIDILGRSNSFQKVSLIESVEHYPFFQGTEQESLDTMKLNFQWIENESESRLNWPVNMQGVYMITNQQQTNSWGEFRGYRVMSGYPSATRAIRNSTYMLKNAQWSLNHLSVTVQKDTEPSSSATLNQNLPWDPLVNFDNFFNGECLLQKDLVLWVTLGMHHFPNTQDIPNTILATAHSSFFLTPFNYFDREQSSYDATDGVFVSVEEERVNTYGHGVPECEVGLAQYYENSEVFGNYSLFDAVDYEPL